MTRDRRSNEPCDQTAATALSVMLKICKVLTTKSGALLLQVSKICVRPLVGMEPPFSNRVNAIAKTKSSRHRMASLESSRSGCPRKWFTYAHDSLRAFRSVCPYAYAYAFPSKLVFAHGFFPFICWHFVLILRILLFVKHTIVRSTGSLCFCRG